MSGVLVVANAAGDTKQLSGALYVQTDVQQILDGIWYVQSEGVKLLEDSTRGWISEIDQFVFSKKFRQHE